MTVVAVVSTKGGVAKTTTAVAVAAGLASLYDTLLVDFDPSGQCTYHFGLDLENGVFSWLTDKKPFDYCLLPGRPAALRLLPGASLTRELFIRYQGADGAHAVARRLRELAQPFVVVDTAASVLQDAALIAADQVIIPFIPEGPGLDGLDSTLAIIREVCPHVGLTLLPTQYETRGMEHRRRLAELAEVLGEHLGLSEINAVARRMAVPQAALAGETIWEFKGGDLTRVKTAYSLLVSRVLRLAAKDATFYG